jgi:hypothetical protein
MSPNISKVPPERGLIKKSDHRASANKLRVGTYRVQNAQLKPIKTSTRNVDFSRKSGSRASGGKLRGARYGFGTRQPKPMKSGCFSRFS